MLTAQNLDHLGRHCQPFATSSLEHLKRTKKCVFFYTYCQKLSSRSKSPTFITSSVIDSKLEENTIQLFEVHKVKMNKKITYHGREEEKNENLNEQFLITPNQIVALTTLIRCHTQSYWNGKINCKIRETIYVNKRANKKKNQKISDI